MSFTIKCNKCGNEQTFEEHTERKEIDITVNTGGYMGGRVDDITIWCDNPKCTHNIDIKV